MTVGATRWAARNALRSRRRGVSIGEVLAEARRQAGLTVTQVSHQTLIRETIITAIEGDDYSARGGDFYTREHIRSIARAVETDPEPLIREYDSSRLRPQALDEDVTDPLPPIWRQQRRRPAGPVTPRARRQRRPPTRALVLGVALVAGLGLTGYLLASPGHSTAPSAGAHRATPHHADHASHAAPAPTATAPAAAAPRTLTPASAAAFGFTGGPGDHSDLAHLAIDRNPATAWHTDWYTTAQFGNLYPGTGLLMDMGRPVTITAVRITLGRAQGAGLQLRVGSAPALASLRPVAHSTNAGGVVHLRFTQPAHGRYVLIWFTRLPPEPVGTFRASVYSLQIEGRI
jgi:Helix-turn-helix domain